MLTTKSNSTCVMPCSGVAMDGGTWGGISWWHPVLVQKQVKTKKKVLGPNEDGDQPK